MPELPEVETLKRQLSVLKDKTTKSAEINWPKMVKPLSVKEFQTKIKNKKILAILNDKIADGKDVSWIWDTSWEALNDAGCSFAASGFRAWDLALRFKYAGISLNNDDIQESIYYSIRHNLNTMDKNFTLYILPTYTAMLETQKVLSKMGAVSKKWHKD